MNRELIKKLDSLEALFSLGGKEARELRKMIQGEVSTSPKNQVRQTAAAAVAKRKKFIQQKKGAA